MLFSPLDVGGGAAYPQFAGAGGGRTFDPDQRFTAIVARYHGAVEDAEGDQETGDRH